MPKPLFQDNGSGMHTHQSLWKAGKNLFYDKKGYGLISDMARYYIGGLIKHAHALCGFIAPTTNSYRRLVPGYEAPINLVYSARNRSALRENPDVLDEREGQAAGVQDAGSELQPVLCVSSDADGGTGRDEKQDRAAQAHRQGPI